MRRMSRKAKADYWMKQLTAWHASQLSLSGYCRLHSLSTTTMRYWRQVLADALPLGAVTPTGSGLPVIVSMPGRPAEPPACPPLRVVVGERLLLATENSPVLVIEFSPSWVECQ